MQSVCLVFVLAALASAEPPLSKSGTPGYPRGAALTQGFQGAEVIAARTSEQGNTHNGFARNIPNDRSSISSRSQGYEEHAAVRNSIDENSEPANYNFGYMVSDSNEGSDFGHREERVEERAQGQYHVLLPDGRKQTVDYEADGRGFKPQISYEHSEVSSRSSGYDVTRAGLNNGGRDARAGY